MTETQIVPMGTQLTLHDEGYEIQDRKVVLISGGTTGLGLEMAAEFARQGHIVTTTSHNAENVSFARQRLVDMGVVADVEGCDCRNRDQVDEVLRRITARHGRIDIVVNCAGIIKVGPIDTMAIEDFEDAMDTMYWGIVYTSFGVLPGMRARGYGRIVNIASIGGVMSVPHLLPYSAAKAAAIGFSKGLASELSGSGVSVLTVVPGLMRTGSFLNARFAGKDQKEFRWFTLASSTPGITVSAEAAARRIVRGALGNESMLTLSVPANLAARAQGLMPGTLVKVLGIQNRLMPGAEGASPEAEQPGRTLDWREPGSVLRKLSYFGHKAASRLQRTA